MRLRGWWVAIVAIAYPSAALSAVIGVYGDPECSTRSVEAQQGIPFELFVRATAPELEHMNISGAEFRIVGIPPSWAVEVVPNPAATIALGNPVVGGTNIAFPVKQPGTCAPLFTLRITPTDEDEHVLRVVKHTSPSRPNFSCPLLTVAPFEILYICVESDDLVVNGPGGSVSLTQRPWSTVKQLFR